MVFILDTRWVVPDRLRWKRFTKKNGFKILKCKP